MAFVYRKQNQSTSQSLPPGPGHYNTLPSPQQHHLTPTPSFANRSARKLWQQPTPTPGPGQYHPEHSEQVNGQYVLVSSPELELYVVDGLGGSSMFRSLSRKCDYVVNDYPGPGEYEVIKERNVRPNTSLCRPGKGKTTKLVKYLYEQSKKQQPPCLHSTIQQQQPLPCDQLNQIHLKIAQNPQSPLKNSEQQPIHTTAGWAPSLAKNKYTSAFNSRVERNLNLIMNRPQTSGGVGPGSYNIEDAYQNTWNQSFNCRIVEPSESRINISGEINRDKKPSFNVGPGSYQVEVSSVQKPTISHSKGIECFGSKQSRFNDKKTRPQTPGPQSYFKLQKRLKSSAQQQLPTSKIAFNSSAKKASPFFYIPFASCNELQISPSPCSYNPKNDFTQLLKKNYEKGSIGRFGSTVERFKDFNIDDDFNLMDQRGLQCISETKKNQFNRKKSDKWKKPTASKKKKIISMQMRQPVDNRPLVYDSHIHTIAHKVESKMQIQAPFLVSSQRFPSQIPASPLFGLFEPTEEYSCNTNILSSDRQREEARVRKAKKIKTQTTSILKKYAKMREKERMGAEREKQNVEMGIGPQTYNPQPQIRKSFNCLFRA